MTVKDLAADGHIDVETALITLLVSGLEYQSGSQSIQQKDITLARRILNLPPISCYDDPCNVECLAIRANKQENTVRDLLVANKILSKHRLKRVPRGLLKKAELLLGLRTQEAPPKEDIKVPAISPKQSQITPETPRRTREEIKEWPTIGPEQEILFISPNEISDIHWCLVKDYLRTKDPIDPPGVRSHALLESAAHRPRTSLGFTDKYPTVAMAAAALLHSIVLDHAFHNGNKRTAFVSMLALLDKNGWILTGDQDDIYDFLLEIADHKLNDKSKTPILNADKETLIIAGWLQNHIRRVTVKEQTLQFRQLRVILNTYGCTLNTALGRGNRVNITRGKYKTQIHYRDEGSDVDKNSVHKVRKDLGLDEANGYDSDIFYNCGAKIPEYINKYRKVLDRLAKI